MDARNIPFRDEFDVIGAFDVLEHIDEDVAVIDEVRKALRPGGGFLMSVPQHPALWSQQDERAFHVRRYTAAGPSPQGRGRGIRGGPDDLLRVPALADDVRLAPPHARMQPGRRV